jgi:hypothetical protein
MTGKLGRVAELVVESFVAVFLVTVGEFLALDTVGGPRHRGYAFRADFLFAMEARSKRAIFNAAERQPYAAQ